jgi:hypothetical protein
MFYASADAVIEYENTLLRCMSPEVALYVGTGSLISRPVSDAVRNPIDVAALSAATRMTHLRHGRLQPFAAQKHCSFLR